MLHEAIFYLWNCDNEEELLDILHCQEFLHTGDEKLMQRIVKIAKDYYNVQDLCKRITHRCTVQFEEDPEMDADTTLAGIRPGLYLTAFCSGLDQVLEDYRKEIIDVEDILLKNPQFTMSYILSRMEKYVSLFSLLKSMFSMIKMEKTRGCLLVGWLHSYTHYGINVIVSTANKIQSSVNSIFYRQLSNWLIFGDLVDEYDEFFISNNSDSLPESGDCVHDEQRSFQKKQKSMWKFSLKMENLPEVIPLDSAESILFIGQMVWLVRIQDSNRDVWQGQQHHHATAIQNLETRPFDLAAFNATVHSCREQVVGYLWQVLHQPETGLRHHMRLVRDYYGLGRGELFQQYVLGTQELQEMVTGDGSGSGSGMAVTGGGGGGGGHSYQRRLDALFHETARKLYGESDKSHTRFVMGIGEMRFEASWPLDILVFNPYTMSLYNRLFVFLLRIQKTQVHLHKLWWRHTRDRKSCGHAWSLRHNLQFLVDNLQYYLQVDVIEAQFSQFESSLEGGVTCTTGDVTSLHARFLADLLSRTFVIAGGFGKVRDDKEPALEGTSTDRIVYSIIGNLLDLCDEFCVEATTWEGELESEHLNGFQERLNTIVEMLLRVLYSLHEKVSSGHHLLQLLHRLDFNRWYTKGSELNFTHL